MTASAEGLPAWTTEAVHLEPYSPAWPERAAAWSRALTAVFGADLLAPVEHVGSTAVPGLAAKPVVDLMLLVEDLDRAVAKGRSALDALGWRFVGPELDGRPWRRFFVRVSDDERHRLGHLHVLTPGAPAWHDQLRFRDRLRASVETRDGYERLKRDLATVFAHDREAYTERKTAFVRAVLDALPSP